MVKEICPLQTHKLVFSIVISFVLISVVNGAEDDRLLQQTVARQATEINLLQARLDLETWKHLQIDELYRDGHASWLQVRRQQLTVDSIAVQLEAARRFQIFLSEVEAREEMLESSKSVAYRPRESKPIKVLLPGSVRIIGWVEGQMLTKSSEGLTNETPTDESEMEIARQKLDKARRRHDALRDLPAATIAARENASLRLNLAQAEVNYLKAFQDVPAAQAAALSPAFSFTDIENLVTPSANDRLETATAQVAAAEAAAKGHVQSVKVQIAREKRRAAAIRGLHKEGHATDDELKLVNERVAELNSRLKTMQETNDLLIAVAERAGNPIQSLIAAESSSVSSWPTEVYSDWEFVFHLVDLRRAFYQEQAAADVHQLKSDMLSEVLKRLEAAAGKTAARGETDSTLYLGQRNEIESYRLDVEFANANRQASIERQQILIFEEQRFSQQAIAMYDAACNSVVDTQWQPLSPLAWPRLLHLVGAVTSLPATNSVAHFSYLESGNLNWLTENANLAFVQSDVRFCASPLIGSICEYSLLPVDTSLMTHYSGRTYSSVRGLQVEPEWMNYFRKSSNRNSVSTYAFPQLWKNQYRHHVGRPFGDYYPYPNGILRSDLRSRITPGQVPWYLPGSPANIRADQIRNGQGAYFDRWSSRH